MASNKQCCGCFDLATGSKIIGAIVTVTSALSAIYCIVCIAAHRDIFEPSGQRITESDIEFVNIVFGIALGIELLIGLSGALLIVGATKESSSLMLPYMIISMIIIVLTFFINGIGIFAAMSVSALLALVCLAKLSYAGVQLYWWICVLTHYKEINLQKRRPVEFYNVPTNFSSNIAKV